MIEVKVFITQEGMCDNKWRWSEVHAKDGYQKDHCPYDNREEAAKKAKEVMDYFGYSFEIVDGNPPDEYPKCKEWNNYDEI
jgi:hypothetical protein